MRGASPPVGVTALVVLCLGGLGRSFRHTARNAPRGLDSVAVTTDVSCSARISETLLTKLDLLHWKRFAVITDDYVAPRCLQEARGGISVTTTFVVVWDSGVKNEQDVSPGLYSEGTLSDIVHRVEEDHVLVLGSRRLQADILRKLTSLTNETGRFSRQVLDTHWFLLVDADHVTNWTEVTSWDLFNLAVLAMNGTSETALLSLRWTQQGSRLFKVHDTMTSSRSLPCSRTSNDVQSQLFPNAQFGLNGVSVTVAIQEWTNFVIGKETTVGNLSYTGWSIDLLDILANTLNFSYTLVVPPDGEWGDYRNGSWTGIIGFLDRKEADLTTAPIEMTYARRDVIDWTSPVNSWTAGLIVRTQDTPLGDWRAFLQPFTWQVYAAVVSAFLSSVGVFMVLSCRLQGQERENRDCYHGNVTRGTGDSDVAGVNGNYDVTCVAEDNDVTRVTEDSDDTCLPGSSDVTCVTAASLFHLGQVLFGSLLGKALELPGTWTRASVRVCFVCWCMLGLILTSCYSGKLTSLLVGFASRPPFTSLKEMVARDDYKWGMLGGTSFSEEYRTSTNPTDVEFYNRLLTFAEEDPEVLASDPEVHIRKSIREKYAFVTSSGVLDVSPQNTCGLTVLTEGLGYTRYYQVLTPTHSALTARLNKVVSRLQDAGVLTYLRSRWFPPASGCQGQRSAPGAITVATLQGPFYLAAAGLLLSGFAFTIEWLYRRK